LINDSKPNCKEKTFNNVKEGFRDAQKSTETRKASLYFLYSGLALHFLQSLILHL